MAKLKFTALVSEMRGKLNGSVLARNRGGNYIRTKVTPTNPQSLAQVLVRARLAQFAQGWRSLTQEQRDAWNASTLSWTTTNVFGDVVNPSGNTLYTRLNCNITNAGGTAISTPPTPVGAAALSGITLGTNIGAETISLTIAPAVVPQNHALVIEATPQMSPGISNANSQFRQIEVVEEEEEAPFNLWDAYTAKFGAPAVGQKIFVRARLVMIETGERSQALAESTICA